MLAKTAKWKRIGALGVAAIIVGGGVVLAVRRHRQSAPPRMVYTSEGYGGYVPARVPAKPARAAAKPKARPADPVKPAQDAYNAGHYKAAQAQAKRVIAQAKAVPTAARQRQAAFAQQVLAYSTAREAVGSQRTPDLKLARVDFAAMRVAAAGLPDKGLEPAPPGQVAPTLEAEAAFQHAVCTNALGDKAGAEAEYAAFMRHYPDSPLLHAAVMRLQRMHGGDMTPSENAVFQQAQKIALSRQKAKMRDASLCGPECLAELLRREGKPADVEALAKRMGTSDQGTTMAALADAAKARGFSPQGLALTQKGLAEQALPVIALVAPGHYVLVDAASLAQVTIWDPDAHGIGHGGSRIVPIAEWRGMWRGATLILHRPAQAVLTAQKN